MKLKVLVITNLYPNNIEPNRGIFIRQQLKQLAPLCDIQVIAPVPWVPFNVNLKIFSRWSVNRRIVYQETIDGIVTYHPRWLVIPKIFRALYGFFFFFSILPKVLSIKKTFLFDVIDAQWVYPDGFAATLLARLVRKPVVIHALGCDINLYTSYFMRRNLIVWCLKKANGIVAVSNVLKNKIVSFGIAPEQVQVIPNGINEDSFRPMSQQECRNKLALPIDKKIVLFIGSLEEVKGVGYLLDAFSQLNKKYPEELCLVMVGQGSLERQINSEINKLGLDKVVTLIGGVLHDEIPLWFNACDVFCLPSIREGMPNVILEALACKKPVVATRVGGIPEIISSDEYGKLVPPGDSEALANAIQRVLEELRAGRLSGQKFSGLTWEENAKRVFAQLLALVN